MTHSSNLRKKVIELLQSNKTQVEIYKFLNISKSTVIRYYNRYK